MIIYFINKNKCICSRKAVTFVELTICIILTSIVMGLIYKMMSHTRQNYMYGVVNLQNLQEARIAINYLTRDFSSCCPGFLSSGDNAFANQQNLRNQIFDTGSNLNGSIRVTKDSLLFYKYVYDSEGETPVIEEVRYVFNPSSKTLERSSTTKDTLYLKGFKNVEFSLYTHELAKNVPMLWVKFVIHDTPKTLGATKIGSELELTTTLSSNFIESSKNNKYWRYETSHKKL